MAEKCRICLDEFASDVLSDLHVDTYKTLTGFEVLPTEPQRICGTCSEDLSRVSTFFLKCQQAEEILKRGNDENEDLKQEEMDVHEDLELDEDDEVEHTDQFECEFCLTVFGSQKNLKAHYRKVHKGKETLECACGKRFFHFTELERHQLCCARKDKTKKKDLEKSICCHCGKIMAAHYLDRHIKDVHERINSVAEYICDICHEKYRTKVGILAHVKRKHMNCSYKCHFCKEVFSSYGIRRTHEVRFHTFNFKYQCNVCDHKFIARRDLVKHRVTHTGEKNFKCDVCGLHVSRKSVLELHKATHSEDRPHVCITCSASFKTKKALRSHKNIHEERKYECPVCNQKFLVNQAMRQHVGKRHPEFELPPPGTVMNKAALKRITEVSEKYNVNVDNLLMKKLPMADIAETCTETQYEIQGETEVGEVLTYASKSMLHLKQEFTVEAPMLISYTELESIQPQ